jgi:Ca-activated chloride channel family protein
MAREKSIRKFQIKKISFSMILFITLIGFLIGSVTGHYAFQKNTNDMIKLTMVYSSEKSSWITATQSAFYQYWDELRVQNPNLKPITLDFQPYGSGSMLTAMLNGEIHPTIWSPASNLWVPLLNSEWSQYTQSNDLIAPNYTRMIYSPVVIATWENFYNEHPFTSIQTLHDLIIQNPGLIKMAHTDPRDSNSGYMATIMMVDSFMHKNPSDISLNDIANTSLIQYMRDIESSAIFYGTSTGFLGKYMDDQGPNALQITFLYEDLVQSYSKSAEQTYGQKIIAVYPSDGTLFSDHPFCILNADWVTPDQRYVAEQYINFISSISMMKLAISNGFRPINQSILSDPSVQQIYNSSFDPANGVTNDPNLIKEISPPSDGLVIARIPDLWLMTRNSAQ